MKKQLIKQQGLSLIELMVSLVIGLVLVAGMVGIFSSSKHSYRLTQNSAGLQERGQFTINFLVSQIREAAYFSNPEAYVQITGTKSKHEGMAFAPIAPNLPLEGMEGGGSSNDSISFALYKEAPYDANDPDTGDCVRQAPSGPAAPRANFDGSVSIISMETFDIQTDSSGVPGLYCNGIRLVDGIESMQFNYGEDLDGDGVVDRFLPYDQVSDANHVISVNVAVLVSSPNEYKKTATSNTYTLLDTSVSTATDRRMRRVFSASIRLRNRCARIPGYAGLCA